MGELGYWFHRADSDSDEGRQGTARARWFEEHADGDLIQAPDRPEWHADALCNGDHGWYDRRPADAKQVCNICPVQQQCLEAALDRREEHGVWGGRDFDRERARDRARKRIRRKASA